MSTRVPKRSRAAGSVTRSYALRTSSGNNDSWGVKIAWNTFFRDASREKHDPSLPKSKRVCGRVY